MSATYQKESAAGLEEADVDRNSKTQGPKGKKVVKKPKKTPGYM